MSGSSSPDELDPETSGSLAMIARAVSAGSEVLELGPGPGTLTRHLSDVLDCQVDCIEVAPEMASSTRRWARDLWEADLDTSELAALTGGRSYDVVVTADVLEHLASPAHVLEQCRTRLRPEGDLFVSLPNVGHAAVVAELLDGRFPYTDFGILDRTHRWFFTRSSILKLLRDAGFRVEHIDHIIRMPETTEFQRRLDQLSDSMRDGLLRHADALTYQFVIRARVGEMDEREWATLEAPTDPAELTFRAKLYWIPEGEEASETKHVAAFGRLGRDRQALTFLLPEESAIRALRFDPAEGPGFVRIESIEIRSGTETVLRLAEPSEIAERCALHAIEPLPPDGGFLMRGEDPFLALPLRSPLPPGPNRTVVVEMSWPASRDYALALQRFDVISNEANSRRAELISENDTLRARVESLCAEHAAHLANLTEKLETTQKHASALEGVLRQVEQSKGWRALEWLRALKPGRRPTE